MKKIYLAVLTFFSLVSSTVMADRDPWYTNVGRASSSRRMYRTTRTTTRRSSRSRRSCNSRSYRPYLYDKYSYVAYDCDYCPYCTYCDYCTQNNYCNCDSDYYPSWGFNFSAGPYAASYYY